MASARAIYNLEKIKGKIKMKLYALRFLHIDELLNIERSITTLQSFFRYPFFLLIKLPEKYV
jgi:hypothetical protein